MQTTRPASHYHRKSYTIYLTLHNIQISSTSDESIPTVSSDSESSDADTSSSLSSTSSSSSSSDSEAELSVENQQPNVKAPTTEAPTTEAAIAEDNQSMPTDAPVDSFRSVLPYQGRKETRMRNQRRRDRKKMVKLKSLGILSSTATMTDFKQWSATIQAAAEAQHAREGEELTSKEPDTAAASEATRQELLDTIASGGIEMEQIQPEAHRPSHRAKSVDASASQEVQESKTVDTPAAAQSLNEKQQAASEPPRRRAKLDLASSKRLLFGSLGLRTPKTKDDEHTLREKLMRNLKPKNNVRNDPVDDAAPNQIIDDDSWKDKVVLKAVECSEEGIELSTPPFPFVQRWDPQQQGHYNSKNGQGGKSKKRKRNRQQYEGQEQVQKGEGDARVAEALSNHGFNLNEPSVNKNKQAAQRTDSEGYEGAINDQLMRDATGISATAPDEFLDAEDIPALPEDISACKILVLEETVPGTIFAFKQLDMSQDTNWQPKISDYRTATVDEVLDDGLLQITLAQRDWPDKVKAYNAQTGKRLYSKFEMPEYEDAGVDNEEGVLEIAFADLIEPRLIRAGPAEQTPNVEERQPVEADAVEAEDGDVRIPELDQALANPSTRFVAEKTNEVLQDVEPQDISEAAEMEILKIIKESGFNSDVADGVTIGQGFQSHENSPDPNVNEVRDVSNSPRFDGFDSSPPNEATSKQLPSTRDELDGASLVVPPSDVEDCGDGDFRPCGSRSPDGDSLTGDVVDETVLPQLNVGGECLRRAFRDTPEEADHQFPSQELSTPSSPPRTASQVARSKGRGFRSLAQPRPMSSLDGTKSDPDDLPTLETVYSARTRTVKSSTGNQVNNSESPEGLPDRKFKSESVTTKRSSPLFESRPTASQIPAGTQIVDLTLSSDAVDPDGSGSEYEYKGSDLPDGPGWVEKRRTRATKAEAKRSTGRAKRTRSEV